MTQKAEPLDLKTRKILFSSSKNEAFTPKNCLKKMCSHFSKQNVSILQIDESISIDYLKQFDIVVYCGPRSPFDGKEFAVLKQYVEQHGGNLLIQIGERAESYYRTNINLLLEQWGITINSDNVIRTVFYKYFHPKEVCIENGILNRTINQMAGKTNDPTPSRPTLTGRPSSSRPVSAQPTQNDNLMDQNNLIFVYPYGCTLNVDKPSVPILSSGSIAYPLNRPIGAVYSSGESGGRVCVLGSVHVFHDQWIEKEENTLLFNVLFKWLLQKEGTKLNKLDAESPEISDYHYLPDSERLSTKVKPCLQESEDLPKDFTTLFDDKTFRFDTNLIPEAVNLFSELHVKHEPLSLIPPAFETPLPPLHAAVYPPILRELPPPSLDLFDLDEQFASEEVRLAQLTNRCQPKDLDYYIKQSGGILGITPRMKKEYRQDPKRILEFIFRQITFFKKNNQSQWED